MVNGMKIIAFISALIFVLPNNKASADIRITQIAGNMVTYEETVIINDYIMVSRIVYYDVLETFYRKETRTRVETRYRTREVIDYVKVPKEVDRTLAIPYKVIIWKPQTIYLFGRKMTIYQPVLETRYQVIKYKVIEYQTVTIKKYVQEKYTVNAPYTILVPYQQLVRKEKTIYEKQPIQTRIIKTSTVPLNSLPLSVSVLIQTPKVQATNNASLDLDISKDRVKQVTAFNDHAKLQSSPDLLQYAGDVREMVEAGHVAGVPVPSGVNLEPDRPITRQEFANFVNRVYNSDKSPSENMRWLNERVGGALSGNPNTPMTAAEIETVALALANREGCVPGLEGCRQLKVLQEALSGTLRSDGPGNTVTRARALELTKPAQTASTADEKGTGTAPSTVPSVQNPLPSTSSTSQPSSSGSNSSGKDSPIPAIRTYIVGTN